MAAQFLPNGCSRKMPLSFRSFEWGRLLEHSFLEHFCLDQFSVILGKFYMQDSRTPRLLEHFWVPILGASCSNKLFVGTVRPSWTRQLHKRILWELISEKNYRATTKGQNRFIIFHTFSHFFIIFPQGRSPSKQRVLAQGEQKRRKDNKKKRANRFCTLVVARLSSSYYYSNYTHTHICYTKESFPKYLCNHFGPHD